MQKLKSVLHYLLTLALAVGLLWLSFRNLTVIEGKSRLDFLWETWRISHKGYLWVMVPLLLLSHLLRAYRWKMLLRSAGNQIALSRGFLALMVGYLFNLVLPRGGEIARCYGLRELEDTPFSISLGTVVAERVTDIACLLLLFALSAAWEWHKLTAVKIPWDTLIGEAAGWLWWTAGLILLMAALVFWAYRSKWFRKNMVGFRDGILSVLHMDKNALFAVLSILIWGLYFLMTYCAVKAFPPTDRLELDAVLALLVAGSIAISIPLPAGMGSYHALAPVTLVALYGLERQEAIGVVFILHAWQTLLVLAFGALSFLATSQLIRWKKRRQK